MRFLIFAILFTLSNKAAAIENELELNLQCTIAGENDELGYSKKLYDDVFIVELRSKDDKSAFSQIRWTRKHPGSTDYSTVETIRGCSHASWTSSIVNGSPVYQVTCANDGDDGSLVLDAEALQGELSFYYPQIGYPERSVFAVDCEKNTK